MLLSHFPSTLSHFFHSLLLCLHAFPPLNQILLSSHLPSTNLLSPHLWTFSLPHLSSPPSLCLPPCVLQKPRPSVLPPAPIIRGHCFFFLWFQLACLYAWVFVCVRVWGYVYRSTVTWRNTLISLHLFVSPFLCLPLSTQGNHIVTAYFRVPTQPLTSHLSASHALFSHLSFALHLHSTFFSSPLSVLTCLSFSVLFSVSLVVCVSPFFTLPSLSHLPSSPFALSPSFCPKFCSPAGMVF